MKKKNGTRTIIFSFKVNLIKTSFMFRYIIKKRVHKFHVNIMFQTAKNELLKL